MLDPRSLEAWSQVHSGWISSSCSSLHSSVSGRSGHSGGVASRQLLATHTPCLCHYLSVWRIHTLPLYTSTFTYHLMAAFHAPHHTLVVIPSQLHTCICLHWCSLNLLATDPSSLLLFALPRTRTDKQDTQQVVPTPLPTLGMTAAEATGQTCVTTTWDTLPLINYVVDLPFRLDGLTS